MMKKEFKFIDLFAGIGGFHISMDSFGGKCVFSSEIDKFARVTYHHNYSKKDNFIFKNNLFNNDITDENLNYGNDIPNFDILCGGFPCQPFSNAGLRKGFNDTRGTLFFNIESIIKQKIENGYPPKVIFLENVKGFRNHDKGNTFKVIKENLDALGYNLAAEVLNSKNFGLPQNRERFFMIAWNRDLVKKDDFSFPYGIDSENNIIFEKEKLEKLAKKTRVGDVLLSQEELFLLEKESNKTYTISEKLWEGHQRRKEMHKAKGNGFGYSLFTHDSPYTSTISARYYKDGSEILIHQENNRPRKLHPIEAARLQGYPIDDWFEIPVSDVQAYKQFGNSVSIPVIKAISNEIVKQLL